MVEHHPEQHPVSGTGHLDLKEKERERAQE